ncbi:hypothetical protein H8B15_02850 [Hymenobacter sp. BT507]|uniref:Lipoprotein n=1 Tax=Hymenobacter citatus TaxID=2763506 RepID=A0ABR7MFY1_9BACT|nr:hypothetical protein [Hymenobacter citatus]MBC6609843.1 hypothetical protein [Hymenobacter citatus]
MKKHLLLFGAALSLTACYTTDEGEAIPSSIVADFDQEFTLNYQQQARLDAASQPELIVEVTDMQYKICPKNVICFSPDVVAPTLRITDAQGNTQQMKVPVDSRPLYTPKWIDTTSVRANGRRYMLYYTQWEVDQMRDKPGKKDIAITLRITK